MNVKVEIQLTQAPTKRDEKEIFGIVESLTDDPQSIMMTFPTKKTLAIIVEFTIIKAQQIDVVDNIGRAFWMLEHYDDSIISFPKRKSHRSQRKEKEPYTAKQGQYLAFIYYYSKINGSAPAEVDFQRYFEVTPPTIHRMILQLEKRGLITRTPRESRSIQLLLSREELPDLE